MVRLALAFIVLAGVGFAWAPARALDVTRTLAQLHHTAWTLRDGMPAYADSIAQTPDGYLWIGAPSGLYRFDGVHLEPFVQKLPGGGVVSLTVTPSGDLWIGSATGVSRLRQGRLTSFNVPGLGRPSGIRHIAAGRNGEVWVATDKVARFDGRRWQTMDSDWGTSELYRKPGGVWGLAVGRDGVVWTKNLLGLYFLRPGSTRFIRAEGYAGSIVDFARAADGRLWTADAASKRFYALPELGSSGPPPPPQVGAAVPPGVLGRVTFDRDGALWCANAVTGGLYRIRSVTARKAEAETFTPADGLTDGIPGRVFEDQEGDIWVGTSTGLNRFAPANVVTESSISIRSFGAEIAASKDAVYVADGWPPPAPATGHRAQRLYAITDGAPRELPINIGNVTVLNGQGWDSLLIGSRQALVRLRQGVVTPIPLPKGADSAGLVSATQDGNDLWAVIGDRGLFRRRGEGWAKVTAPGLETFPTTRARVDRQGAVWLFDEEQVRRFTAGRVDVYAAANGPNSGGTNAFASDQRGVLLGGDRGVSWFDGRRFHTLSQRQAPFLGVVLGVVADDVGGTWFHTAAGIYRVSTSQLDQAFRDPAVRLDGQIFDARDGLRSAGTLGQFGGSAVRGPDGRLWFLNADNVAWIDPHRLYRNPVPPPVSIRSLTVEGRSVDAWVGVRKLAAGVSNLQIDYTALSLQNPERVKFRYRLEGVDKTWIEAGDRRQAFYTRLGPGRYRFHVIAANNDGVWNTTGASLRFEIPPTFLQSGWFVLLCVTAAALALWLAYSLRMRQVTAAIQSRHEERMAERERIARELHDTLLQGFQGLILRFQAIMEGLAPGPERQEMGAALERADEVLISGRDSVRHIRRLSRAEDLGEALTEAAQAGSERDKGRFQLVLEGKPRALHPVVAEELAAIGREAILNASQHSRGQLIGANLVYDGRGLTMSIADNGVGIDAAVLAAGSRAGHFGLLGMRERADKIEARLTLSSRSGAGVKVEVFVPARIAFAASRRDTGVWRRRLCGALRRRPAG